MVRHVFQKPSLHLKGQDYTEREYGDRHSVRMSATQRSRLHMHAGIWSAYVGIWSAYA